MQLKAQTPQSCTLNALVRPLLSQKGIASKVLRKIPQSQSQNLALTVVCVPYSIDSGTAQSL